MKISISDYEDYLYDHYKTHGIDTGLFMKLVEEIGEVAEVYLNGKELGVKLFPPYTFNISSEDIKDENDLTVIVTNHKGYLMKDEYSAYMPFEASGLIGPVMYKEIK